MDEKELLEYKRGMAEERRLVPAMQASEGWGFYMDLRAIESIVKIFRSNHDELHKRLAIDKRIDLPANLQSVGDEPERVSEVERLFHNYLASAFSLSTSIYQLATRRQWLGKRVGIDLRSRTPYGQSGLPAFMFTLRHNAQHHKIPVTLVPMSAAGFNKLTNRLVGKAVYLLNLDELFKLDWTTDKTRGPVGKAYLETLKFGPAIESITQDFTSQMLTYAGWFDGEFRNVHHRELEQVERFQSDLSEARKPYDAFAAKFT